MKPIDKAREEMTAAGASAEHSDFMKSAGKILVAGMKLKKIMVRKGLKRAKTECPVCKVRAALQGHLVTGRAGGRHPGGAFRMWCETPDCNVMME